MNRTGPSLGMAASLAGSKASRTLRSRKAAVKKILRRVVAQMLLIEPFKASLATERLDGTDNRLLRWRLVGASNS